jgi:hypothetical protein
MMKIFIPVLVPLLGASSMAFSQDIKPSLYGIWLVHETRQSEDHWLTRDYMMFHRNSGLDWIDASTECRTQGGVVKVDVTSRAKIRDREFVVFNSEDESEVRYGVTCTVRLHRLTARYELSQDGESVTVNDGKQVQRWDRHE